MTTTEPPFTVHFLASLTIPVTTSPHGTSFAATYGSELTVTQAVIAAGLDRAGRPPQWLVLLDDEAAQIRLWGEVRVRRGPWPATEERLLPDSPAWEDRRAAALRHAANISDPDEQRIALAKVREKYGVPSSGRSRTLATYGPR